MRVEEKENETKLWGKSIFHFRRNSTNWKEKERYPLSAKVVTYIPSLWPKREHTYIYKTSPPPIQTKMETFLGKNSITDPPSSSSGDAIVLLTIERILFSVVETNFFDPWNFFLVLNLPTKKKNKKQKVDFF